MCVWVYIVFHTNLFMTSRSGKSTSPRSFFVLERRLELQYKASNCNPVRPCHGARIFAGLQGVQAGAMHRTLAARQGRTVVKRPYRMGAA